MLENEKKRILHFIQHLCLYKFTSIVECSSKQKKRRKRRDSRLVNSKYTQNVHITMRLQRMKKKRNSLAIVISEKRNTKNNKKRIFIYYSMHYSFFCRLSYHTIFNSYQRKPDQLRSLFID